MIRLQETIRGVSLKYGVHRCLVGTLTFPYRVDRLKEAQEALNRLLNFVRRSCIGNVWSLELTSNNCIHFHVVLVMHFDAMTGTAVDTLDALKHNTTFQRRAACNGDLSHFWSDLETAARKAGFGRVDLSPIR